MASTKNEAAGKSVMEFEIEFNGIMTVELRGKVLVEIVKSLIYQRGQIPLPFDQLKRYVQNELAKPRHKPMPNEVFQDSPDVSSTQNTPEPDIASGDYRDFKSDLNFRKLSQAYDTLSTLLERLNVVIGNELFQAEEALLLTGATQVTPREVYHVFLPNLNEKICQIHEIPKLTLKSCMVRIFREIITNNILWESCSESGNVNSLTNILILVKMDRNAIMSDHMEPQMNFKIPTKATKTVRMPVRLKCAECRQNEDGETELLNREMLKVSLSEENSNHDRIWVKILPIAKGFSNSLIGKPKK